MSADNNLHDNVLGYFEAEFAAARKKLKDGGYTSFKDRVLVSVKITEALSLLSPYVRSDKRARNLVRQGETLREELLSVRDVIKEKSTPARKRQNLLISQIMRKKKTFLLM